jgi:hypothetical protein
MWYHLKMKPARLNVRLPRALHQRLGAHARDQGVSLNTLMTALLAGGIGFKIDEPRHDKDGDESAPYYKVERMLRASFPSALKSQPSGGSVDLRVYFREKPSGEMWAGLALLDSESGEVIEQMPLADQTSLRWMLGIVCDLGFDAAPRARSKPRGKAA